jgi:phosphatidylglycerophosphatase A
VPAGKHEIKFELKPESVIKSKQASSIASFLIWGILAFTVFSWFRKQKSTQA